MTPKDKAKELILKFAFKGAQHEGEAKKFALITVDEILKAFYLNTGLDIVGNHVINFAERESNYWEEVKKEIEKL